MRTKTKETTANAEKAGTVRYNWAQRMVRNAGRQGRDESEAGSCVSKYIGTTAKVYKFVRLLFWIAA